MQSGGACDETNIYYDYDGTLRGVMEGVCTLLGADAAFCGCVMCVINAMHAHSISGAAGGWCCTVFGYLSAITAAGC